MRIYTRLVPRLKRCGQYGIVARNAVVTIGAFVYPFVNLLLFILLLEGITYHDYQ